MITYTYQISTLYIGITVVFDCVVFLEIKNSSQHKLRAAHCNVFYVDKGFKLVA
jgi:hypothetical protein